MNCIEVKITEVLDNDVQDIEIKLSRFIAGIAQLLSKKKRVVRTKLDTYDYYHRWWNSYPLGYHQPRS